MIPISIAASARSLAMIMSGRHVKVNGILFDVVRDRCARAGLGEGDIVQVMGRSDLHILIRNARGVLTMLERELAQFIVVGDAPSQPWRQLDSSCVNAPMPARLALA